MILLDTHVLVRYVRDEGKLGRRALSVIQRALDADGLFVSPISFWEVAILAAAKRIGLETTVAVFRTSALENGAREIAIDGTIAVLAAELPDVHGDPADRMLVATAIHRGLTFLTADTLLLDWELRGYRAQDATE
jgi:PIN domain nuclease of toxin-antitoxin system